MNRLLKGSLAVGGGTVAAELIRRALRAGPRYEAWERVPYRDFPNKNILAVIDGGEPKPFRHRPLGQLVEMGSEFAVNEVMGVKFSGFIAALFWRATYLYKLESPNSRVRIAADWLLDLFYDPPVTQIRR